MTTVIDPAVERSARTHPRPDRPGEPPSTDAAVRARDLTKTHGSGETAVPALAGVDLDVARATFTAIMGSSRSGKSTLMHCLAGLDTATSGRGVTRRHRADHPARRRPDPAAP